MLMSNIDVFFCDVISLLAQVFIVSSSIIRDVYEKKKKFYGSLFVIWLYLQKAMYRPCDLDLWPMKDRQGENNTSKPPPGAR